jgi:hypothetical protein
VHDAPRPSPAPASDASSPSSPSGDAAANGATRPRGRDPFTEIAGAILFSPFWLPNAIVETDEEPFTWSMLPHPYADGAPGYFARVARPSAEYTGGYVMPASGRRAVGLQVSLDGIPPVQEVGRVQAQARLLTMVARFELDASSALYVEPSGSAAESAWVGRVHAAFRFAQGERVQFRAGLGARHWLDRRGGSLGVDGLYAVDIFWGRPWTSAIELTGGTLGNAWDFELRATLGFTLGIGELFVGYDGYWIGPKDGGHAASLGGPLVGVRAYF